MMKVKEFMITDVVTVTKETSIKRLLEILVTNKIGGVPVVDAENKLQGMITDGDVIRYLQPKGRTVYDMFTLILVSEKEDLQHKLEYAIDHHVDKIMRKKEIFTVNPNDDLEAATSIFSKYRFKKIPVVDDSNKVSGVISRGDVIRYISTKLISDK
ncbi:CBS domain-containing protein [Virgibacillus oceani]|uniref:CBS domain-containing protein n=1 Tax=Virgibacillus oceani TaxID=1479511 RepID=A0A917HFL7_9BACI|nr:CBS domain-containing protein [Virgibacillus oceani]GGG77738.1 CBS domain-containing protein [Virgibacillus oceani]